MNRFTTEHPLASQPSLFDRAEHPKLSFVCSSFVFAFFLTPLMYGYAFAALTDEAQCEEDPPFPESWADFVSQIGLLFLLCLLCAFLLVSAYRFLTRHSFKTRYAG